MRRSDTADIEHFLDAQAPLPSEGICKEGDIVNIWRVTAMIGKGGNGEVYRVVHKETGEIAALKIAFGNGRSSARIAREAEFLESHRYDCFPLVYNRGNWNGFPFFVMEILEPLTLPRSDRGIARLLLEVGHAVEILHKCGFVHRDIKPANIMCRRAAEKGGAPRAVLIDLGLLKRHEAAQRLMGDVSVTVVDGRAVGAGTPRYAAPEQFSGGDLSPAADIHALGILADECFGGKPPPVWERIIARATSTLPMRRYTDVASFLRAVRRRYFIRRTVFLLAIAVIAGLAAVSWQKFSSRDISLGEALDCPEYEWETSSDPWYVQRSSRYEGGAAVLASGGTRGVAETYMKTVVSGEAKKMSFRFQLMYYNGRFTVEVDGATVFSDESISMDIGDNWRVAQVDIPAGEHEIKFTYRHPGVGYRNLYNGVRIDTVSITD